MEHNASTDDSKNDQPVQPQSEFKKSIKTWTNRRASSQMKRVAQMEVNKEINDMMHIMNEDSGKKASEVSEHMKIYSNKTKANQIAINSFTPSKAFYIMGHGGTTDETFMVPQDCIVVVKVGEGELFYQIDKYFPIIYNMDLSILTDPIRNRPELVKALGSVAIYYPGTECPNFTYIVVDDDTLQTPTILSEFGSGVTDISLYKEDQHKSTLRHSATHDTLSTFKEMKARRNSEEIKQFILNAYQYSIYPTPQQVEIAIDKLIENNITDINDIIIAMKRLNIFRTTQEDLCQMKGVFYNFVCRPNDSLKPIFKTVNRGNVTNELANNVQGLLTLQNSPAPFHNTNSIRNYSETSRRNKLQKLKDAEANLKAAQKEYANTAYGNNGTPEHEIWSKALNKRLTANRKVQSIKNNTIRKSLQSRLEESIAFRKPGIRNTIESTPYNNTKRFQEYRNEYRKLLSERNQDAADLTRAKHYLNTYKNAYSNQNKGSINLGVLMNYIRKTNAIITSLKDRSKKIQFFEKELKKMLDQRRNGGRIR